MVCPNHFEITSLHIAHNASLTLEIFPLTNVLETGSNLEVLEVEKISAMETSGVSGTTVTTPLVITVGLQVS